ncbi:rho GTPase-activating protein 23-like, partial [Neolamprologus brichardi]|uniref:rho GTPase-activating protein 23-like n=1 Tax=Neolamprologus brichardi TaxID=32507 RepID=UPI001643A949
MALVFLRQEDLAMAEGRHSLRGVGVSLESLQAQEDARSKRHSTSELGIITFSDVHKEGWLHYKQILTEKGKKVGGSMRPWRRAFSVLRSQSLFLYKDKRDAVIHGAGAGPGQVEHCPISIRCCLIDIAYSETKRKHTLRLTTQDFCEYLLQAEDNDDMLAWIKVIRENSKTDNEEIGFSRQALINKKLNDYKKHRNLALVFGPTLVRTSEDNMTDMVTHMPDRYKIVETLILH